VGGRSFLLHVPVGVRSTAPVVFTFHGRGSNAQQQLLLTGVTAVADREGFMVAAPNARGGRWDFDADGEWEYLQEVADSIPCADPSRFYASGMSMGSAMTFALACAPQRRFAAFGGVALAVYGEQCEQASAAPIVYFHGTDDRIVPFEGGRVQGEEVILPSVPDAMRDWARHNDCATPDRRSVGRDVVLRVWRGCVDGAQIRYYVVRGGGHTWPGADPLIADAIEAQLGTTTQTVDATQLMWEFFAEHRLD
jgi:polyhydroxybutyrate depolymerase